MKNKQIALEMIAAGYDVEMVMSITGFDPEELFEILNEVLGEGERIKVTLITQQFYTQIGVIEMNLN